MTNDEFAEAAARARGSWSRRLATNSAQRLAVRQVIATMPKHLQGSAEAVAAELARLGPAAIGLGSYTQRGDDQGRHPRPCLAGREVDVTNDEFLAHKLAIRARRAEEARVRSLQRSARIRAGIRAAIGALPAVPTHRRGIVKIVTHRITANPSKWGLERTPDARTIRAMVREVQAERRAATQIDVPVLECPPALPESFLRFDLPINLSVHGSHRRSEQAPEAEAGREDLGSASDRHLAIQGGIRGAEVQLVVRRGPDRHAFRRPRSGSGTL